MLRSDPLAQTGSPDWICLKLDRALAHLFNTVFARTSRYHLAFITLCVAALLLIEAHFQLPFFETRLNFFGEFSQTVKQRFGGAALILLCAVVFWRSWPRLVRRTGAMLLLTFATAMTFECEHTFIFTLIVESALPIALVCGATYAVYATRHWRFNRQMALFSAVFILSFFYQSLAGMPHARLVPFNEMFLLALVLFSMRAAGGEFSFRSVLLYVTSPLHVFYALPLEASAWPDRAPDVGDTSRRSGLAAICGGAVLLVIAGLWHSGFMIEKVTTAAGFLWRGWTNYIFFYLGWLGYLQAARGVGQWLGFAPGEGSHYALFSPDPLSRWQRWNYYYYWFYLRCVWLPVARKTQSFLLGIIAVWTLNYFLHYRVLLNEALAGSTEPSLWFTLGNEAVFFCGHATVIYIAFLSKSWWPSGASRRGWIGVLLTHFLMALIHGVLILARD
jgi:hypothetical protein